MKKIFAAMLLAIVIFFGNNFANAQDVYCGTYDKNFEAYFVSESLNFVGGFRNFDVTIKILKNNQIDYVYYEFRGSPGNREIEPYQNFKNSKGKSGKIVAGTLESNILSIANKFWQEKFS